MGRRPAHRSTAAALLSAAVMTLVLPALVAAHPLGNFTINHSPEARR